MLILDPGHPAVAAYLADREAAIRAAKTAPAQRRQEVIAEHMRRAAETREARAKAKRLREASRRANAEVRRKAKAAYDAKWHREHRATGRPNGRPRTSTHPRAEYWRDRYARMRAAGSN